MKELVVGNGLDTKSSQGPLINEKAVSKVERHIKDSVNQGARVICGGNRLGKLGGTFFEPTVLTDVTNEMPVCREETFGPVAPLLRYGKLLYIHSGSVYGVRGWGKAFNASYGKFLVQFEKHTLVSFPKTSILIVFEKLACACFFQISLEIIVLPHSDEFSG